MEKRDNSDRASVAASVGATLLMSGISVELLEPLVGSEPKGSLPNCVSIITARIVSGEIDPTFAQRFTEELIEQFQTKRGCKERYGTDLLLKLLLETCPSGVDGKAKRAVLTRTLSAYQGPCCGNSPCTRGNPP
jgi:hypothetical protein